MACLTQSSSESPSYLEERRTCTIISFTLQEVEKWLHQSHIGQNAAEGHEPKHSASTDLLLCCLLRWEQGLWESVPRATGGMKMNLPSEKCTDLRVLRTLTWTNSLYADLARLYGTKRLDPRKYRTSNPVKIIANLLMMTMVSRGTRQSRASRGSMCAEKSQICFVFMTQEHKVHTTNWPEMGNRWH